MNNLNKIAGAGLCAALLAACGAAVNPVVPAAKTLLAPLKTTSAESVLYRFKGYTHRDGQDPAAGLVALNGVFYGTTAAGGGAKGCKYPDKCGTVYRITPTGEEHVLYRFKGAPDGWFPLANLLAMDGSLYGTTADGGSKQRGDRLCVRSEQRHGKRYLQFQRAARR